MFNILYAIYDMVTQLYYSFTINRLDIYFILTYS